MVTDVRRRPAFLPRAELDRLLDLLARRRPADHRPDRQRGRHRLRRDPAVGRPARRLDGRPGARLVPAAADRHGPPVRLRGRPDVLEARDVPAARPAHHRPSRRRSGHLRGRACPDPPRVAFLGCPRLRDRRAPDPGRGPGRADRPSTATTRRAARPRSIIAVECVTPADTCFCTSMGTGPGGDERVRPGHDRARRRVRRPGRLAGRRARCSARLDAGAGGRGTAGRRPRGAVAAARERIGDPVPTAGLPARLIAAADSPRWAEIAERCLACANCTLVCPTCFCTGVTQVSDLDGVEAVAERTWDSCFTLGFAKVAGGNFRPRVAGPLPPVADPQVRDLVGPVRDVRLRRLRPLHHVVPGRHRRPRGAAGGRAAAGRRAEPRRRAVAAARRRVRRSATVATAAARPRRAAADLRAGVRRRAPPRDPRRGHAPPRDRRSGPPRRPARPVRHGRAAGLLRRADLRVAVPPRRPRADDPGRRAPRRAPCAASAAATRSACAARWAAAGRSRPPTAATSSSSPAGSASRRCGRSSTRSSPTATGSARSACCTARAAPADRLFVDELSDARRPARPRRRADRRPRRAGVVRARRRRHRACSTRASWTAPDADGLHLRAGTDDGGDRRRPARPRASPTTGSS